jgi:hypothetical protein
MNFLVILRFYLPKYFGASYEMDGRMCSSECSDKELALRRGRMENYCYHI